MAIILTLGGESRIVTLADRRVPGSPEHAGPVESVAPRLGVLRCASGLFSFAWLAPESGAEDLPGLPGSLDDWLLETLYDCAPPDFSLRGILSRFAAAADARFYTGSRAPAQRRRLCLVVSGFAHAGLGASGEAPGPQPATPWAPPPAVCAWVANFPAAARAGRIWERFRCFVAREPRPDRTPTMFIESFGVFPHGRPSEVEHLWPLLAEDAPARDLLHAGVRVLTRFAAHPSSQGLVGSRFDAVVVPRSREAVCESFVREEGQGEAAGGELSQPYVVALPHARMLRKPGRARPPETEGPADAVPADAAPTDAAACPWRPAVPIVRATAPCPCGSGLAYRDCHGRPAPESESQEPPTEPSV